MSTSETFTKEEVAEAQKFCDFLINLLENHSECLVYYLADTALLDWFGHTIKGPRNIVAYLKNNAGKCKHRFTNPNPVRKIGFRENHVIKLPSEAKQRNPINFSPCDSESNSPKLTFSPVTHLIEKGQGDGPHNNCPESPRKKFKADNGDQITDKPELKYISSNGHIEFHRRSSKKLQAETKWNRPCKLEVAYSATNFEDCVIYMMIYQGNLKCRRNLMKDFDACDPGSE
ncbi:uncharacterized protein LOC116169278 [Photinus pyralis]|uniref:Uncharacterized protein n=1 Tax=Photinus pyralis TaxID=7054 RepID=A0A1Y1M2U9_PHOPY|nr:uncharacterized protein LOC116169278 [Photinus pyralis]XP_031341196.1 uncharacterized protein LOC116169278 [Photinus pyralis]